MSAFDETPDVSSEDTERAAVREAFAVLGHETRLDILLALLDDWGAARTEPRSYAELMDAVGMRDSGKFNYHLDRLRGAYVRQVNDGYVPTAAATALYRAALAHHGADGEPRRFDVDSACPECAGALGATHEHGFLSVACRDCDDWIGFTYPFPENGAAAADDPVAAAHRRAETHVALARDGQCPFCAGRTAVDVFPDGVGGDTDYIEVTCATCSFVAGVPVLFALRSVPAVAAAFRDVGVDADAYEWETPTPTVDVRSRDPPRAAVSVTADRGTATVVVDGDATVRDVRIDRNREP